MDINTNQPFPIGYYVQPSGKGLEHKTPYYDLRYNQELAFMSNCLLGLQVLIMFLGSLTWINIDQKWLS